MLVSAWWTETVTCVGIHHTPTQWLYIHYSRWTNDVVDVQQQTHNQVAQRKFIFLCNPVLIVVALWVTYWKDLCDVGLATEGDLSMTLVGSVSGIYRCALVRSDPLRVRRGGGACGERGVEHIGAGQDHLNLLVCDIYWGLVLAKGSYLYNDCNTSRVHGLPETGTLPTVTTRFPMTT